MQKSIMVSTISTIAAGAVTYLLLMDRNKKSGEQKGVWVEKMPFEKAGIPDNQENAKMVSEGSQFGVDYYNKLVK